jgi:hypothetical protein
LEFVLGDFAHQEVGAIVNPSNSAALVARMECAFIMPGLGGG